jgi:thiol-disulfide isomerase/thioredoxin
VTNNRALLASLALLASIGCNPKATKSGITGESPVPSAGARPDAATTVSLATSARAGERVRIIPAALDTDALSLVRTKRLEAKAEARLLVVYVGATWCEPCKKFKAELESGRLDDRLGRVTLLAFDADKDVDRLGSAGYTFNFVPFVALPGADGHPSDSQQATGKGAQAWRELLGKLDSWQRP